MRSTRRLLTAIQSAALLLLAAAFAVSSCQRMAHAQIGPPPGGGTPGGAATDVQYSKAGAFAGSVNLLYFDTAVATPAAPTAALVGSGGGGVSYSYVAIPVFGLGYGLSSPVSNTIADGPNPLNGSNYVTVTTAAVAGAGSCDVFQFGGFQTTGFAKYVGNVACGSSINDQGTYSPAFSPYGSTPNPTRDNSAGVLVSQNLKVTGNAAFGGAPLSQTAQVQLSPNPSGNVTLSAQQTVAGIAGIASSSLDATGIQSLLKIVPADATALALSTTHGISNVIIVPATVSADVAVISGIDSSITYLGSNVIKSTDAAGLSVAVKGSTSSATPTIIDGERITMQYGTSGTIFNMRGIGILFQGLPGGTLTTFEGIYIATSLVLNTVTNWYGLHIDVPGTVSGTLTNLEQIRLEDAHAVGGTTSYAIHQVGALSKSLFEGQVQTSGVISVGTKFTTTGCSVSATAGGATAGTYTSGTTGTCAVVVTMAGATGLTAPTGWSCFANNRTTPANPQNQSTSSTTTATITGTTVSGDVVNFGCTGY